MKILLMGCMRLALVLVFSIGLAGCDSKPEQPAADTLVKAQKALVAGQTSIDELPDRNIERMDVCALLPGGVVASALNLKLAETQAGTEMCSYTLRRDSGPEVGVVVSLTKSVSFIVTRNTSENARDVPGLGVAAFTRKVTGSHQDLWVARKDGLFFHVLGYDPDIAEPVAKVALETIP
ncbi:MAG: hypothetical protein OEW33_03800 [Nitrospirota bacterium]|nr:hypothetical protein [Nitrospirota bacterium]